MADSYDSLKRDIDALRQQKESMSEDPDYATRKAKAALFFDDQTMLEFLASERFPDDPQAAYRYQMIDGDIFYRDLEGNLRREFERPEDAGILDEYIYPNIVPATTIAADMTGAIVGAEQGFKQGVQLAQKSPVKHPVALAGIVLSTTAAGGAGGAFATGAAARGARQLLIDQFYNLPPEEMEAAAKDLGISTAFSAIPFGAGPVRELFTKFRGREETLKYLVNLRAGVQGTIDEAAKLGFKLTPAEAADIAQGAKAVQLQYFLSKQPQIVKIQQMYGSRAAKIREAVNAFADSVGSRAGSSFGSVQERMVEAARETMKELTRRRKERSTKLYETIRNAPEQTEVDLSPVIGKLDAIIADTKKPEKLRQAARDFRETLMEKRIEEQPILNPDGTQKLGNQGEALMQEVEVEYPLTNLMDIHDRRTTDMEAIVKGNLDTAIAGNVISFREDVTDALDAADPLYNLARRVYDPTKPNLQATERSAIGRMSKLFESPDTRVAKSLKDVFDPSVSTRSMRNAKRVLQTAAPDVWQDVKKFYINDQLDRFTRSQALEEGIPSYQRFFATPKQKAMLQELLEPEEFESFYRMIDLMGLALNKVPRSASPTQPFGAQAEILADEAGNISSDARSLLITLLRGGQRLFLGNFGDEYLKRVAQKQTEAYHDRLVSALLDDPNPQDLFEETFQIMSSPEFTKRLRELQGAGQGVLRAGEAGLEEVTEGDQPYSPDVESLNRMIESMEEMNQSQPQSMIDSLMFEPLPVGAPPADINPAMSPTILPNAEDRELAMRRQNLAGIAALV